MAASALYSLALSIVFVATLLATRLRKVPVGMALVASLFLTWYLLGWFGHWPTARQETQTLAAAGAITGIGYLIGRHRSELTFAWSFLNWSFLLFCAISISTFSNAPGETNLAVEIGFDRRLSGWFGSPNTAATLFGLSMLLAIGRILFRLSDANLSRLTRTNKVYYFASTEFSSFLLFLISGVCLLLTVSRAGILVGFVSVSGLVILELMRVRRKKLFRFLDRKRFWLPTLLVFLLILALSVTGQINPHHAEALLNNLSSRLAIYDVYYPIWLERPFFGHGLGSFNALNDSNTTLDNAMHLVTIGAAHNVFLQWLIQAGVVGLTAMSLVFAIIFYPIFRALMRQASSPRHFIRMSIAATVLVFSHGLVDYALEIPSVMWTYSYILGLSAGFAAKVGIPRQGADE